MGSQHKHFLDPGYLTVKIFSSPRFKLIESGHAATDTKMPLNILLTSALKTHLSEAQYATHLPELRWGQFHLTDA